SFLGAFCRSSDLKNCYIRIPVAQSRRTERPVLVVTFVKWRPMADELRIKGNVFYAKRTSDRIPASRLGLQMVYYHSGRMRFSFCLLAIPDQGRSRRKSRA